MSESELKLRMCEQIEFWTERCESEYFLLLLEMVDLGMDDQRAILILKDAYESADAMWSDEV